MKKSNSWKRHFLRGQSSLVRRRARPQQSRQHRFQVEALEPRVMLDASTPLLDAEIAKLKTGLEGLANWVETVENYGQFGSTLPIVGTALGDVADAAGKLRTEWINGAIDFLDNAPSKTRGAIETKLESLLPGTDVTFTETGGQIEYTFNFNKQTTLTDRSLDLGDNPFGLSLNSTYSLNAAAGLSGFSFGLVLDANTSASEAFFINSATKLNASLSLDSSGDLVVGKANVGMLELNVGGTGDTKVKVSAGIQVGLNDPTANDGRITLGELVGTSLGSLVTLTPGTAGGAPLALDVNLPIKSEAGSFNLGGTIVLTDTNLFDATAPSLNLANPTAGLTNFNNISPSDLINVLRNLGTGLETFSGALDLQGGIPFVEEKISDAINLAERFTSFAEKFFEVKLQGEATHTASELAALTLTANAVFKVKLSDQATFTTVTVNAAVFASMDALVSAINTALGATGVLAENSSGRVMFKAANEAKAPVIVFEADNVGMRELGFLANASNSVPKFTSIQGFVSLLDTFLPDLNLAGINLAYNAPTGDLKFTFKHSLSASEEIHLHFDDGINILNFGQLSLTGEAHATFAVTALLDFRVGINLSGANSGPVTAATTLGTLNAGSGVKVNTEVFVTANTAPVATGVLSSAASFNLYLNGGVPVAVSVPVVGTNTSSADLLADLNTALTTAGVGNLVAARLVGGKFEIYAKTGATTKISIAATAGTTAVTQLGFPTSITDGDLRIARRDGVVFDVDLSALTASSTLQDVINAINNHAQNIGVAKVVASINDAGNGLKLVDSTTGSGALIVAPINRSPAAYGLGIVGAGTTTGATATLTGLALNVVPFNQRVYIEDGAKVEASASLTVPDIDLIASLGMIEAGIVNGSFSNFSIKAAAELDDPDGKITVSDLIAGPAKTVNFTVGNGGAPKITLPLTFAGLDFLGVVAPTDPKVELTFSLVGGNSLDFNVGVSGMPDFSALSEFSTDDLIALLKRAVEFIKNSDLELFNTKLPLLELSLREVLMKGDNIVGGVLGGAGLDSYLNAVKNLKTNLNTFLYGTLVDGVQDVTVNSMWETLRGYGGPALPNQAASADSFLNALSAAAVEKFSVGVGALEAAIASLPDTIADPALFQLPGKVINAATALKAAIDSVSTTTYNAMTAAQKANYDKFKAFVLDVGRAVPSMQKIVDVLMRALGLDTLIDFNALVDGANGIVKKVDDILTQIGVDKNAIANDDPQKVAKQAALDAASTAFTTVKTGLTAVFNGVTDKINLSLLELLKRFNEFRTTAQAQITALTNASALSATLSQKIGTAGSFFAEKFPGRFNFAFEAANKLFKGGLEFDLNASKSLNLDLGITEGIGPFPLSFESGGALNIGVGANLKIDFGVDGNLLVSSPASAIFLYPTTQLALTALVDGALTSQLSIGGLSAEVGYAGSPGTLKFMDQTYAKPASLVLGFNAPGDGRINFNNSDIVDNFKLTLDAALKADAPVRIQGTALSPNLKIEVPNVANLFPSIDAGDFNLTFPTIDFSAFKLDIFTILQVLESALTVAENGLKADLLAKLPLVGDTLNDVGSVFTQVRAEVAKIRTALQALNETFTTENLVSFLQAVFYQVLGPGGLTIDTFADALTFPNDTVKTAFKSALSAINMPGNVGLNLLKKLDGTALTAPTDVAALVNIAAGKNLLTDPDAKVETNLRFAGSMDWTSSFDLGFNAFNLVSAGASGDVLLSIAYDFEIGLGVGKKDGIYLILNDPTAPGAAPDLVPLSAGSAHASPGAIDPEIEFEISLTLPGAAIQLDLLFLTLLAEDNGSEASGFAYVDLKHKSQPNKKEVPLLQVTELNPDFTFGANVDVNLGLTAKIKGDTKETLPSIKTEFLFGWEWNFANGGNITDLQFDNVRLDLGGFISKNLKPILQRVNTFLEPVRPILDLLELEVPVISQLSQLVGLGPFTFLDGIGLLGEGGETVVKVIGILTEINNFIKQTASIPGNIFISFGDFDLLGGSSLSPTGALPPISKPSFGSLADALNQPFSNLDGSAASAGDKAKISEFTSKSSSTTTQGLGLQFPLLTNPASALKLLVGQDVDLITWDIPRLAAGFEFSQVFGPIIPPFPIFATIGGNFEVFLDLFVGMDTRGIRTGNFLNGFYFGDLTQGGTGTETPEAGVNMELYAGAEINVGGIVRAGIVGGISASLTADWNDPNGDGKVYLDEILTNFSQGISCIFDLSGELSAFLRAFLKIEIPLVFTTLTLIDESFTIVKVTLLDFNHSCPPLPPPEPARLVVNGSENVLYVNIGPDAGKRQPGATDGDEEVTIRGEFDSNGDGVISPTADLNGDGFISEDELREGLDALATGNEGSTTFNGINGQTLAVTGFGQTRIFKNIHRIVAVGGAGNDSVILHNSVYVPASLSGGAGDDILQGGTGSDTIDGGDGDDELIGAAGNDSILGGGGNDLITAGAGQDTVNAGSGDDTVYGGDNDSKDVGDVGDSLAGDAGNDKIYGHLGNDTLSGGEGNDTLVGGAGNDSADGGGGDDQVFGDEGNDTLVGGTGNDSLYGGTGHDVMVGGSWSTGTSADGNDALFGNAGDDLMIGGNATVTGITRNGDGVITARTFGWGTETGGGNDTLVGGSASPESGELDGNDEIYGRGGNDLIAGGHAAFNANGAISLISTGSTGNDIIVAGQGADTVHGQGGDDYIYGDDATVTLDSQGRPTSFQSTETGTGGNDRLFGNEGRDLLVGGAGADRAEGGSDTSNDTLVGDNANVTVTYSSPGVVTEIITTAPTVGGSDTLLGDAGDDVIIGGASNDSLVAGAGNDIVLGDNGKVVRLAGTGALVEISTLNAEVAGNDTIFGNDNEDTLLGGSGADQISGDLGNDIVLGDNGKITYTSGVIAKIESLDGASGGKDTLSGASGNDTIFGGADDDSVNGGANDDILLGDSGEVVFTSGSITSIRSLFPSAGGKDTVVGSTGNDTLVGGFDNDTLLGDEGTDVMIGDNGQITVASGVPTQIKTIEQSHGGDDSINGGNGSDTAFGGTGDDNIQGGADTAADYLFGDNGLIDLVAGVPTLLESSDPTWGGKDTISGGEGDDVIVGGSGSKTGSATTGDNATYGGDSLLGDAGNDIVLGDNGTITRDTSGRLLSIVSSFTGNGGDDTIVGAAGNDTLLGGFGSDSITGDAGEDRILGDSGELLYTLVNTATVLSRLATTADSQGGSDTITGNNDDDTILGGAAADTISGGAGNDRILGDNGELDWLMNATSIDGNNVSADTDATTLDRIGTKSPTLGGGDSIDGDAGNDTILGGTGADSIRGDTTTAADNGGGHDRIFGDHGVIYLALPANRNFFAIDRRTTDGGAGDSIWGNGGDDTVLGQQGADTIFGGDGNDDIIGGHNVAGASLDNTDSADAGDFIDAGRGFDVVAGDNARIIRLGANEANANTTDLLFRTLAGAQLYAAPEDGLFDANVNAAGQAEPGGPGARAVVLIDNSDTTSANRYGADKIAGGAGNDTVFGQLGNDTLHGDGYLDAATLALTTSGSPESGADKDGNDYLEGNAGGDTLYGGRGQDNILGGSSDLFGLTTEAQRRDGADVIYGGNGALNTLDNYGDASAKNGNDVFLQDDENVNANGHSRDADVILGDNGRIFRILASAGTYQAFAYDGGLSSKSPLAGYSNPTGYGSEKIQVRAFELIDYTPGVGAVAGNSGNDRVFGEAGDDTLHGMDGSDSLFGDGQDDDIYGGVGHDWIHGGTGEDGILGDDGLIRTSRNGVGEPLYGITALGNTELNLFIKTPGSIQQSYINIANQLNKSVDLEPFALPTVGGVPATDMVARPVAPSDDVIFGGLGNDSLHGGAGDDAISGAEALSDIYALTAAGTSVNPGNLLGFQADNPQEFALFDEYNGLAKYTSVTIDGTTYTQLLNFLATSGGKARNDGRDKLFGDLGNDWLVGGTNRDNLYGGFGNDLLDTDDDKDTGGGSNSTPDERTDSFYADIAYGGGGRDILIANSAKDRLIDWVGEFNSYLVPFAPYGAWTISRTLQPQLPDYLEALSRSDGADRTRTSAQTFNVAFPGGTADRNGEPYGELGMVIQQDPFWKAQTGAPDDPQAGNIPGGTRDEWKFEAFGSSAQTSFAVESAAWSVKSGTYQVTATDGKDATSIMYVENSLPSYFELEAIINTDKPRSGVKANGALIFDYQSDSDFKFAGIDVSNNKLIIGQRTANGWQVLASTNIQVVGERDYQVKLYVHGAIATVQLGGTANAGVFSATQTVSYTFANKLNQGLVGLGSDNSTSRFDNVRLQVLPPNLTAEVKENFDDGVADFFNQTLGSWSTAGSAYTGTPAIGSNFAISTMGLAAVPGLSTEVSASLTIAANTLSGFVFDYQNATNFKYAGYDAATKKLVIGHRTAAGWFVDASFNIDLAVGSTQTVAMNLDNGLVNVALNGVKQLSYRFNGFIDDGQIGLLVKGSTAAKFDNVTGKTLQR